MRSELIRLIFQAYSSGDDNKFFDAALEIVKDEERKNHHVLANDLRTILNSSKNKVHIKEINNQYKKNIPIPRDNDRGFPLFNIHDYYLDWSDLIINKELQSAIEQVVEEVRQHEILKTYRLKPKQKLLFCGPPGTGKTLAAKVISSMLSLPLLHVNFDAIVSSYLGETASNLRNVFEFIQSGNWVILFDEFDIIGKKRDDLHEHGEIKRVVNNFMQLLDQYSGNSLLISTTNHEHLLDIGLRRRFEEILFFDLPSYEDRIRLFKLYFRFVKTEEEVDLEKLASITDLYSAADISTVCKESAKRMILLNKRRLTSDMIYWAIEQQNRRMLVWRNNEQV